MRFFSTGGSAVLAIRIPQLGELLRSQVLDGLVAFK
jgi:hypothetical protein